IDQCVCLLVRHTIRGCGGTVGLAQRPVEQRLKLVIREVAAQPFVVNDAARGALLATGDGRLAGLMAHRCVDGPPVTRCAGSSRQPPSAAGPLSASIALTTADMSRRPNPMLEADPNSCSAAAARIAGALTPCAAEIARPRSLRIRSTM